jgi:hypothetical protein
MLDRPPTNLRTRNFEVPNRASLRARGIGGPPRLDEPLVRPLPPAPHHNDEMAPGLLGSLVLHTGLALLILLGLPDLFKREPPAEVAVAVTFINPSDVTRTTAVNKTPKANAKPVPPPPIIPEEKPEPPKALAQAEPTPAPPPPSKPEPAPTPPPLPPEPKPPEPKLEPQPPPDPKLRVPEPKPEPPPPPKQELPKPPPPKPPPPKQLAKVEPPKEEKPKQTDEFEDVLKNLANTPIQEQSTQPPKQTKPPPQQQQASSLPNAPLGSQVTTGEKEMIAGVVNGCFSPDKGAEGASSLLAHIQFDIAPDGTVRRTIILGVEGGGNDAIRRAFAEAAQRAPLNPQCNKLPIPPGKYDQLKDLIMNFSIEGAL